MNEKAAQENRAAVRAAYAGLALNWQLLAEALEQDVQTPAEAQDIPTPDDGGD